MIYQLPLVKRDCSQCAYFEPREDAEDMVETWCGYWNDPIDDVKFGETCLDFVRVDVEPITNEPRPQATQGGS
jgi:hypothetical protein